MPPSLPERIGLLGVGVEGRATLAALRRWGHTAPVTGFDDRPGPACEGLRWTQDPADLHGVDLLVRSPGFAPHHPLRCAADALGLPQTTATNWFVTEARDLGATVIGVTGSKGKSTTTSLVAAFLTASGRSTEALGNIGRPALDALPGLRSGDVVALELSSYQCADLHLGPDVAVLVSLFPEHMDWHGGVAPYYAAKWRLVDLARDRTVVHASAASLRDGRFGGTFVPDPDGLRFSGGWFRHGDQRLWSDASMRLRGAHNRDNALLAYAATAPLGVEPRHAEAVLARFEGLPHRLMDLGMHHGLRWVDDAISTAPEAIAVALDALGPEVATLICGGQDRGYDVAPAVDAIARSAVRLVVALPETGGAIADRVSNAVRVDGLQEAVALARARTPAGRTVLFSPGGPSYHSWKNFEARGAEFVALATGEGVGNGPR